MPTRPHKPLRAAALLLGLAMAPAANAQAAEVAVAVSIAPAHSLAAMVAGDRAEVTLLVPAGASPHDFALRPSDARALSTADLVIGVGAGLDGFLDAPVRSLGENARILVLSAAAGVELLPIREEADWTDHDEHHDDHHADGAPHDAETHARHMADPAHHEEHEREHGEESRDAHEHGHHHGAADPHLWLSPANARAGVAAIAAALSEVDPDGAPVYAANAGRADARLAELDARLRAQLAPVADRPFAVFHDGFQYLEHAFGLTSLGAITGVDAAAPSPRQMRAIQTRIRESAAVCVFSEPQFDQRLVTVATEGTGAKAAVLDPLGAAFPPGQDHYIDTMDALGDALAECLG